jgi:hypothetical protein
MDFDFEYNRRNGEQAELIIKDYSGKKIDTFKWNLSDKKLERKLFSIVRRKYGMFKIEVPNPDKDLDWLKKT